MNRIELISGLGKFAGQVLTAETARELVAHLFPERSIDPARFAPQACGSLTFQAERLRDILPEIHPLHELHWSETEAHRTGQALNMDYGALMDEEKDGTMLQFTARAGAQLVGNIRVYLRHCRHTQELVATEDTWYLHPGHRQGRNGLRFLEYAGFALMDLGCREFRTSTKHSAPAAARLLELCYFDPVATEFVLNFSLPQVVTRYLRVRGLGPKE